MNRKGLTLIELIVVISILGILFSFVVGIKNDYREGLVLKLTAYEIRNALQLAQQLSIDETRSFNFEIIGRNYLVKENLINGREVLRKTLPNEIKVDKSSNQRVTFNRHGVTNYSIFTIYNNKGDKVRIETHIGTGRTLINFVK